MSILADCSHLDLIICQHKGAFRAQVASRRFVSTKKMQQRLLSELSLLHHGNHRATIRNTKAFLTVMWLIWKKLHEQLTGFLLWLSVCFQPWRSSAAPVLFTCWRRSAATCWTAEGRCRSRWVARFSLPVRDWELPSDTLSISNRVKVTWWLIGWRGRRRLWSPRTSAPMQRRTNTSPWRRRWRKNASCTPPFPGVWTTTSSWVRPDPQRLLSFSVVSSVVFSVCCQLVGKFPCCVPCWFCLSLTHWAGRSLQLEHVITAEIKNPPESQNQFQTWLKMLVLFI